MNVDELTDSLHATSVATPLDLDRVTRDGRRIRTRSRAVVAAGLAAAVAAVAVPVGLWQQPAPVESGYAAPGTGRTSETDETAGDSREVLFERTAPIGYPEGGVLEPGMKFYLGGDKTRSVGSLAVWHQQGSTEFGARLVDGDGSLRSAGFLDDARGLDVRELGALRRVPFQNAAEPTFVGTLEVPSGTRLRDLRLEVSLDSVGSVVDRGLRFDVVPGRALLWVSATAESERALGLGSWQVVDADGTLLAQGGFAPYEAGAWSPTG